MIPLQAPLKTDTMPAKPRRKRHSRPASAQADTTVTETGTTGAPADPAATATQAGIMLRLFAMMYDGLLLVAFWMIISAILVPFGTSEQSARTHELALVSPLFRQFVLVPALVMVTWLFYGYFWTRVGQTLGMQTWRLKVLRHNNEPLRWSDAIGRCAAACLLPLVCGLISQFAWHDDRALLISVTLGFFGNYFWILWSSSHSAWHDQLSGTVVWQLPPEPKATKRKFLGWFAEKND